MPRNIPVVKTVKSRLDYAFHRKAFYFINMEYVYIIAEQEVIYEGDELVTKEYVYADKGEEHSNHHLMFQLS